MEPAVVVPKKLDEGKIFYGDKGFYHTLYAKSPIV